MFSSQTSTFWSQKGKIRKTKLEKSIVYAHIKVVVAFVVVNFGGFGVTARNPTDEFG